MIDRPIEFLYTTGWISGILHFTQLRKADVTLRYTSTCPAYIDTGDGCPSESKAMFVGVRRVRTEIDSLLFLSIIRFDCSQIG